MTQFIPSLHQSALSPYPSLLVPRSSPLRLQSLLIAIPALPQSHPGTMRKVAHQKETARL